MKCSACRNQLGAYQDGLLHPDVAAQLREHLNSCVGCRAFAEEMMVVEHRLASLAVLEPRADFTRLVMAAVRTMPAPVPQRSRIVWLGVYDLLAWALTIVLVATGVVRWKSIAADGALVLGKFVVAADGLYRVADHFHIVMLAAIGSAIEVFAFSILLYAGRHYLARIQSTFSGARSI